MTTSQGQRRELILTLEGLKERIITSEQDCVCEVFEDLAEPNRFLWSEWWSTLEQVRVAQNSERFRALLGGIKVLGDLESIRHVSRTSEAQEDANSIKQIQTMRKL